MEFKIPMVNILRGLMEKVGNMQEMMNNFLFKKRKVAGH
jgi:hypothetical protein